MSNALPKRGDLLIEPNSTNHVVSDALSRLEPPRAFSVRSATGPVGTFTVFEIDRGHQRAKWQLDLGDHHTRTSSLMTTAWICLEYVFETLKVGKLQSEVIGSDQVSLDLHRKLGFCQEGCLSRQIQRDGRFWDLILLAHFKDQWEKRKKSLEEVLFEVELKS